MSPDLFSDLDVDYGDPRPSLARARRLVDRVEGLAFILDDTFPSACRDVGREAGSMGAHAVARACGWLSDIRTLDRHGYDAMHARAEDIARRWLQRIEAERLS